MQNPHTPSLPPASSPSCAEDPYLADKSSEEGTSESISQANPFPDDYLAAQFSILEDERIPEQLLAYYRHIYQDKIQRNISVIDFIKHVYGFDAKDIPSVPDGYRLDKDLLNSYLRSGSRSKAPGGFYQTFCELLRNVHGQIPGGHDILNGQFSLTRRKSPSSYNNPLPPIVWSTFRQPTDQDIGFLAAFVEVSKSNDSRSGGHGSLASDIHVDLDLLNRDGNIVRIASELSTAIESHPPLDDIEARAAVYLNELISYGVREYVTGLQVKDTTISLWYGDRFGLMNSTAFDFMVEPHLLVLILSAIAAANLPKLGYHPFMRIPGSTFADYSRASLVLQEATDTLTNEPTGSLIFHFDEKRAIITQRGALGRGTTVIPVRAAEKPESNLDSRESLAAKLCWPHRGTKEDGNVRKIRTRLRGSEHLRHIVDIKCTLVLSMHDTQLPRIFLAKEFFEDDAAPIFKVIVMKAYFPLEYVAGPAHFFKVWLDVVDAHYHVFERARILHGDISPNNIMFYLEGDIPMGVLCDWDLSHRLEKNQRLGSGKTGTPPFMAIDVLATPGQHGYHHDLESFFWLLTWFTANHNPETRTCGETPQWSLGAPPTYQSNYLGIAYSKAQFIDFSLGSDEEVFAHMHPSYQQLREVVAKLAHTIFTHRWRALSSGIQVPCLTPASWERFRTPFPQDEKYGAIGVDLAYEIFRKVADPDSYPL